MFKLFLVALFSVGFLYFLLVVSFMGRKQFSKSDIKHFLEKYSWAELLMSKKSNVVDENGMLFVDNTLVALESKDHRWFPSLKTLLRHPETNFLPKVIVDMGAVKFVVNGADVMRPGVVAVGSFEKSAVVVVVDETHEKPLAIAEALFSSDDLMSATGGKVLKTLHYVGDEFWEK